MPEIRTALPFCTYNRLPGEAVCRKGVSGSHTGPFGNCISGGAYGGGSARRFHHQSLSCGKIRDYEALCRYYEEQLRIAPAGITEVFLHPSVPDGRLLARTPQWRKREWEYYFLKSGRLARLVEKEGFIPVSWSSAPFEELRRKAADFSETPHSRQQKQTIPTENINRRIKHYG